MFNTLPAGCFVMELFRDGTTIMWFHPDGSHTQNSVYVNVESRDSAPGRVARARAAAIELYNSTM